MHNLLSDLDAQQCRAVQHARGPLLVIAGPGSGKTRVLTRRIAYRVQGGVPARRILALTFTNSAAAEMRARVGDLLPATSEVHIGTFHWAGNALLRRYADRLGRRRDFRVITGRQGKRVLSAALAQSELRSFNLRTVGSSISALKAGIEPREAAGGKLAVDQLLAARAAYDSELARSNAVDVDDLLFLSAELLEREPAVRDRCRGEFDEVLVDEYQDTNPVQHTLLALLTPLSGSVIAVGDEDQAIYGWRWADARGVLQFGDRFPGAALVKLETNYRSTKHIVRVSSSLIEHNTERIHKSFSTGNEAGPVPVCLICDDELQEADAIAHQIRLSSAGGTPLGEIAVLYRTNAQSRALEDGLMRGTIPYRVFGARRFYDRPEIRRVTMYLERALDPTNTSVFETLAGAIPGVGPQRLAVLSRVLASSGAAETEFVIDALASHWPRRCLQDLGALLQRIRAAERLRTGPLQPIVDAAIAAVLQDMLWDTGTDTESIAENLEELRAVARELEPREVTLRGLLDRLSIGEPVAGDREAVSLLTLHAAKGREFDTVFMPGMEEGLLPHRRSLESQSAIEEERRLCYVGITRARRQLIVSYAHTRFVAGNILSEGQSRFIKELGRGALKVHTVGTRAPKARLQSVQNGEVVIHPRWGPGTICKVEGKGRETMVTIVFGSAGTQRLQLCHAPLSRVAMGDARV